MKILKLTTVFLIALSLGITSCKKEEKMEEDINSTTNPIQNTDNILSFTYNGVSVNESSFIIREQYGDINITLLNYNGYDFFLKLDDNLNVGAYNFNTSNYTSKSSLIFLKKQIPNSRGNLKFGI